MARSTEKSDGIPSAVARIGLQGARVASWVFDHYVAVAGLVAVVATTFYGLAYARFYAELSLTPEEVGMNPTQILTQSAVGGLTITVLFAIGIFCALLVPIAPVTVDWGYRDRGSWRQFALNGALSLASGAFVDLLAWAVGLGHGMEPGFVYASGFVLIVVGLRIRLEGWRPIIRPRPLRFRFNRYLTAFVTVALPVALIYTGVGTFSTAGYVGERVAEGDADADEGISILGVPIFGIEVEPALVYWEHPGSSPVGMPLCSLYLGTSDGDAVLYDPGSRSTVHAAAADVAIQVRTDLSSCDGPINLRAPAISRRKDGALVCGHGAWESFEDPRFTYLWRFNGPRYPASESRPGRVMERSYLERHEIRAIHCQVLASSFYGEDYAMSRVLRVNRR
jgi:hypothetical protein